MNRSIRVGARRFRTRFGWLDLVALAIALISMGCATPIGFHEAELLWAGFRLKDFVPAADVEVRGLRNRYRIAGVGAPLAATIEPVEGMTSKLSARIPPRFKIPATAFLRLDDPGGALKSGKLKQAGILYPGFGALT